jgi:hypothetical protein
MTTSLLQTNLSVNPYFDDFDETKNYYQVLYKPATAVQTRELNVQQSILQDQIDKFGRSIYQEGSVTEGCSFTFDNGYSYVKINDTFTNNFTISTTTQFIGNILTNQNGLKATIVNSVDGFQSSPTGDLNTFYIKYLNSTTSQSVYANADILTITSSSNVAIANVTVATVANSVGQGYALSVTEGVIFKKGFFIRVAPQTLIVDKYNNVPDGISVGFDAQEVIVNSYTDSSLVDNAASSPNFDAPGADRLKLVPTLITVNTATTSSSSSFFSLVDFKNGLPVTLKTNPQYTTLNKQLAQRTYETNGNYVVNPFLLSITDKASTDPLQQNYLNLVSSPGVGYVQGYRVEFINNNTVNLRKGLDVASVSSQQITANFGYYVNVNQYCGDFNNYQMALIEIHNVAKQAITTRNFLNTGYSSTTKIGTAYCRGFAYSYGTPGVDAVYRLYLSDIQMLPGYNFSQAQSLIYNNGGIKALADIVLQINAAGNYTAQIQDAVDEIMVHPFGQKAIVTNGFGSNTAQYVFRNRVLGNTSSFNTSGQLSVTASGNQQFAYTGNYSPNLEGSFIVIPQYSMYSGNSSSSYKTGTVNVSSTNTYVIGASTLFTTEYGVGDYIYTDNATRRILNIVNSTAMYVDANFPTTATGLSHQKIYPAGVPINFQNSYSRTISATQSTATLNLGENITASTNCSVYFDTLWTNLAAGNKKNINRSTYIQINTSTHPNGITGPWSLGIPDVLNLNHVYVGSGTYSTNNPDMVSSFVLDNGQRDSYYDLASISTSSPLPSGSYLLVSVDNFTVNTSFATYGFFTANSYPIDDANTANTHAIRTAEIPQYVSINTKTTVDLRDSVDFRPYMANTANAVAGVGSANINPSGTSSIYLYGATSPYLPSPDSPFETSLQYYLPRVDTVALTTGGDIIITEGVASVNPVAAAPVPGTMIIGIVNVPAYPTLAPTDALKYKRYDYSVSVTIQQTKRYTMADIGGLDKRISSLEYYTSLNLLEQSASSLLVRSSLTGQNRFQNGILVDPFKDFSIGNTLDPNFNIAIDSNQGEARPFFTQTRMQMYFDPSQSTLVKTGDIVTLPYTTSITQVQQFASKYRNCIEGNIYNWTGTISLDPSGTIDPDITQGPQVISNLNLSQNWINIANAWGTVWGNWSTTSTATTSSTATNPTGTVTNPDGSISTNYQSQTTTTTTQQQQQIGQQISVTPSTSTVNIGNYVTNVNILPYIKATPVIFKAHGLKPNTRIYAFFNSVPVSNYCFPAVPYSGATYQSNGLILTSVATYYPWTGQTIANQPVYTDSLGNMYTYILGEVGTTSEGGSILVTDSQGNLYGTFWIPDSTFPAGQLQFLLTDIYNLTEGIDASSTSASATYFASPIAIQQSQVQLQIQNPQVAQQEVINNQTIQQVSTTTATYSAVTTPAPSTQASTQNTSTTEGPAAGVQGTGGGGGG